ncbi:MAG TPA: hypothetical protein VJ765_07885 [Chitinophagaceae bacterium]|nr:hypothetical protein [Chitinophagaceae bacterium]
MKNLATRFDKATYLKVSGLGTRLNLSFSSQLVFGNKIIALDGIKKRLLVLDTDKELNQPYVIDLNSLAAVSVKKSYGSIGQGQLKNKGIEEFLKRIDLQFEFNNKNEPIVLSFYDCEIDDQRDRPKLIRNAKNWQMILSKIAGLQTHKINKEL